MWKKFKQWFVSLPADLQFTPRTVRLAGLQLHVTKAQPADLEAMYFAQRLVYHGYSPWSRAAFANELSRSDSLYLNVWSRRQLVAFIGTHFDGRAGHITNLSVIPTVQERGIGSYLLQLIIDFARQAQVKRLSLEVRVDNVRAQKLYRRFGFRSNFVRRNYYDDVKVDGLDMVLKLQ